MKLVGEFEIPGLPDLTNRLNTKIWQQRYTHNKKWKYQVQLHCTRLRICDLNLKTAKLTLTRYSSSEPDMDGLIGSFKSCIDSLVECRVIENDRPSNIGESKFIWEKAKPKQGKIRIRIETTEGNT